MEVVATDFERRRDACLFTPRLYMMDDECHLAAMGMELTLLLVPLAMEFGFTWS
jgi:hypothetical protein